jgi:hypothetical protein
VAIPLLPKAPLRARHQSRHLPCSRFSTKSNCVLKINNLKKQARKDSGHALAALSTLRSPASIHQTKLFVRLSFFAFPLDQPRCLASNGEYHRTCSAKSARATGRIQVCAERGLRYPTLAMLLQLPMRLVSNPSG